VCIVQAISAYNEEKHIGRLLEGINHQTVRDAEVILVDSGSTDTTATTAAQHGAKVLHILPEEFTFGRFLNPGLADATSDLVAIASAHVYPVYPDWLECLLEPFADPAVALTYGKQRGDENTKFSEQQIFATWFPGESVLRQTHPFCNNANAAIRRALWELHPYDETLTGLEDLDWANGHWLKGTRFPIPLLRKSFMYMKSRLRRYAAVTSARQWLLSTCIPKRILACTT
jgi:rhamnosyltransferase